MAIVEMGACASCITSGCFNQLEFTNLLSNMVVRRMLFGMVEAGLLVAVCLWLLSLFKQRLQPFIYRIFETLLYTILVGIFAFTLFMLYGV